MNDQQNATKTGLLEFLRNSSGSQFVVPVYQRNYTWTAKKEVKQYIEDWKSVLSNKYDKHFLGILIYLNRELDYKSREFQIIDGQQRLTTTFLILYAIKDVMLDENLVDDAKSLENQYLINQFVPDKLKLKLKPLVSDDEVYLQIVTGKISEIRNKSSNIYKNYLFIKETIKDILKSYNFNDLILALNKLYVVTVPVASTDSPQKIFESINSTGAKLSAADLIRNYVLMDIDSETQDRFYKEYWKQIESYTASKKMELFFRMFLACKTHNLSNITSIYEDFKNWYASEIMDKTPEDILKDILNYAKYYYYIYSCPINEVDKELRDKLAEFRKNLSEMPAPLLMEIYHLYSLFKLNNGTKERFVSAEQFSYIIELINIYLLRRSICSKDTSDITRLFPQILKGILDDCNGNYEKIIDYTKKHLINKQRGKAACMPTDEDIKSYLMEANAYVLKLPLKIIFDKIELNNNPAPVDLSKLSIEHLMPQTPTQTWLDTLNIDQVTYERYLNRIGNLTLATKVDNSKMKNNPFEYKKAVLSNTAHLIMNQEILSEESWGVQQITKRSEKLINQIIKLYPYLSASDDVIVKHEITIDQNGCSATGILFEEDGSVEIQAGSYTVQLSDDLDTPESILKIYDELLEDGVITEKENGYIFLKNKLFATQKGKNAALSTSASVILGANRTGWHYWKENGVSLEKNKNLKNKILG